MTTLRWRMVPAAVAGVAFALVLATACSGPRSGASATSDVSGCAAVLPLARNTVHDQGTLILIRRINQADADALAHKLGVTPAAPPQPPMRHRPAQSSARTRQPKTCLIVYHGNYPQGTITAASPPAVAGHYALMVLRVRHPSVDRILVTDTLPSGLNRRFIPFHMLSFTTDAGNGSSVQPIARRCSRSGATHHR
jgi:hypothetical protein